MAFVSPSFVCNYNKGLENVCNTFGPYSKLGHTFFGQNFWSSRQLGQLHSSAKDIWAKHPFGPQKFGSSTYFGHRHFRQAHILATDISATNILAMDILATNILATRNI